ncbi:MAG: hypothetical protein AB7K71_08535 [Polyangiaceae bacterium]
MADDCSRVRTKWLSRRAGLLAALIGLSVAAPALGADEKPPDAPAAAAKSALNERFEQLTKTIGSIDASGVPCKLGDEAIGCAEAAKAASTDLKQVRKQLTKDIRQLRKAKAKQKLARALEFGSSLNRLKGDLRKLGAADNAEAAQDALSQLNEQLGKAKAQLKQLNDDAS